MEFPKQAIIKNLNPPTYEESLQHDLKTDQRNINDNQIKKIYKYFENKYDEKLNETQKELSYLREEINNLKNIYDSNIPCNGYTFDLLLNSAVTGNFTTFNYLIKKFSYTRFDEGTYGTYTIVDSPWSGSVSSEQHRHNHLKLINCVCAGGNVDIMKYLINSGIDINFYYHPKKKCDGLQYACYYGNYNMVEFLLENGAIMDDECSGPDNFEGCKIKQLLLKYGFIRFKLNSARNHDYTTKLNRCCI